MADRLRQSTPERERETEDQMARRKLGPRGVPHLADTATMTEQEDEQLPRTGEFDGHTA